MHIESGELLTLGVESYQILGEANCLIMLLFFFFFLISPGAYELHTHFILSFYRLNNSGSWESV